MVTQPSDSDADASSENDNEQPVDQEGRTVDSDQSKAVNDGKFSDVAKKDTGRVSLDELNRLQSFAENVVRTLVQNLKPGDSYEVDVNNTGPVSIGGSSATNGESIESPTLRSAVSIQNPPLQSADLELHTQSEVWVSSDAVYRWFYKELYQEEQTFAITLALMGGISQEDIFKAHSRIKSILEAPTTDYQPGFGGIRELFSSPVPTLMEATKSIFVTSYEFNNAGRVKVRGIAFADIRAVALVLEMLGRYYYEKLVILIGFLKEVAEDINDTWGGAARRRSAATLGLIGRTDFNLVKTNVLEPWSRIGYLNERTRYGVTTILSTVYFADGEYNDNIYQLVKHWISLENSYNHIITAVVSSSSLAILDFPRYLTVLKQAVKYDKVLLIDDITASFTYLWQGLRENNRPLDAIELLENLATWTGNDKDALKIGALFICSSLMSFTINRTLRKLTQGDWELWNLPLLYNTNSSDYQIRYRKALHTIFSNGLSASSLFVESYRTLLFSLIVAADQETSYRPLVKYLFLDLCCVSPEKYLAKRTWNWLSNWSKAPKYAELTFLQEIFHFVRLRYPHAD